MNIRESHAPTRMESEPAADGRQSRHRNLASQRTSKAVVAVAVPVLAVSEVIATIGAAAKVQLVHRKVKIPGGRSVTVQRALSAVPQPVSTVGMKKKAG